MKLGGAGGLHAMAYRDLTPENPVDDRAHGG